MPSLGACLAWGGCSCSEAPQPRLVALHLPLGPCRSAESELSDPTAPRCLQLGGRALGTAARSDTQDTSRVNV